MRVILLLLLLVNSAFANRDAPTRGENCTTSIQCSNPTTECIEGLCTSISGFIRNDSNSFSEDIDTYDSIVRAVRWLESKRDADFGWDDNTAFCITALQLTNNSWLHEERLDNLLTAKKLEIDMLVKFYNDFLCEPSVISGLSVNSTKEEEYNASYYLDSHRKELISPGRVAQFVMTLLSMCRSPRNFHGKDLVAVLQRMEPEHDFEVALHTLAICLSGGQVRKRNARKVRKRNARKLLNILQKDMKDGRVGAIDTHSMAIMALQCITDSEDNTLITSDLIKPVKNLIQSRNNEGSFGRGQNQDGSSGNVWSTGLAVQALSLYNESIGWNSTASLQWLISQQRVDGSFLGYVHATVTVLPALAGKGFVDLKDHVCNFNNNDNFKDEQIPTDVPVTESIPHNETIDLVDNITISYTVWFDNNATRTHSINLTVPNNISFYQIMQIAAEVDTMFEFSAKNFEFGPMVHTIGGVRDKPTKAEGFQYWMAYKLDQRPDSNNKPPNSALLPVGVNNYFPEDGDFILFWLKKI